MSIRVRERGFRRRASGNTLVRTIPVGMQSPPPVPVSGSIRRYMNVQLLADYEGIADTTWTLGTTGNINGAANTSFNCYYHHYTTTNQRTESKTFLMTPLRFSIAAPATDGGTYDYWLAASGAPTYRRYAGSILGDVGITDTLLPTGTHGVWNGGYSLLYRPNFYAFCVSVNDFNPTTWKEATLNAIASTTQVWGFFGGLQQNSGCDTPQIAAIRHRVNGVAVGSLILNPGNNPEVGTNWRIPVLPDDTYELDVWLRIGTQAKASYPAIPGKACLYIPTTRVSNGSRQTQITNAGGYGTYGNVFLFRNVDWSPNFSKVDQTYSVTISGHSGWTLKDGTDGPHKMITDSAWTAVFGDGFITWNKKVNDGYVRAINLRFEREIAHVELEPGPLMSTTITPSNFLAYRATGTGEYRTSTTSTDLGAVTHAEPGLFDQAGTTTFDLVPWSLAGGGMPDNAGFEGRGSGLVGLPGVDVPTSITLTRVLQ